MFLDEGYGEQSEKNGEEAFRVDGTHVTTTASWYPLSNYPTESHTKIDKLIEKSDSFPPEKDYSSFMIKL